MSDSAPEVYRKTVTKALGVGAVDPFRTARPIWKTLCRNDVLQQMFGTSQVRRPRPDPMLVEILIEELYARYSVGTTTAICVLLSGVVPLLIRLSERSVYARSVLEEVLAGEAVVCLAVTDGGASGSDILGSDTRIARLGDRNVIDGVKCWITNATDCDYILTLIRTSSDAHFTSFRWILLSSKDSGIEITPVGEPFFQGAGLGHVAFTETPVEEESYVGMRGRGLADFKICIASERLSSAIFGLTVARRMLAETLTWLKSRRHHGDVLWGNAAIRERYARCVVEYRKLESLSRSCWHREDHTIPHIEAAIVKVAVAEGVEALMAECIRLRGADAFRTSGEAFRLAELHMFGIAGGASGALLADIATAADVGP